MKILPILPLVALFTCAPLIGKGGDGSDLKTLSGVYEYVYEHNTNLIENHYIELDAGKALVTGTYYGTSDDFDDAREGYLPGFFMAPISNLKLTKFTIRFDVTVNKGDIWSAPVTPFSKKNRGKAWTENIGKTERTYSGKISGNTITLEGVGVGPRVFIKRPSK